MLAVAETVARCAAVGLGLQPDALVDLMHGQYYTGAKTRTKQ